MTEAKQVSGRRMERLVGGYAPQRPPWWARARCWLLGHTDPPEPESWRLAFLQPTVRLGKFKCRRCGRVEERL